MTGLGPISLIVPSIVKLTANYKNGKLSCWYSTGFNPWSFPFSALNT